MENENYPDPVVGNKIYLGTSLHISAGHLDVKGGLATISKAHKSMSGGEMEWFIEVEEVPGTSYNYAYLMEKQDKLKKQFGDNKASPDPDVDTPWIEEGDFVIETDKYGNKKSGIHHGNPIW